MTRKTLLLLMFVSFALNFSFAQIHNPVKWTFKANHVSGNQYDLVFDAKIEDGWFIYSQYLESDDGPIKTSFTYETPKNLKKIGKNKEVSAKRKEGFDKMFDMNIIKFGKSAKFTQRVEVTDTKTPIKGYLEFMSCDAQKCLPPKEVEFDFTLPAAKATPKPKASSPSTSAVTIPKPVSTTTKPTTTTVVSAPKPIPSRPVTRPATTTSTSVQTRPTTTTITTPQIPSTSGTVTRPKRKPVPVPVIKDPEPRPAIVTSPKTKREEKVKTTPTKTEVATATKKEEKAPLQEKIEPASTTGVLEPVKWSYTTKKLKEGEYELSINAKIDKGWSTYSQFVEEGGPVPTYIEFSEESKSNFTPLGKIEEVSDHKIEGKDPVFDGMHVIKYKKAVKFVQKLKVKDPSKPLKGFVEFMACDNSHCLAPKEEEFSIDFTTDHTAPLSVLDTKGASGTKNIGTTRSAAANYVTAGQGTPIEETFDKSRADNDCTGTAEVKEERSYWQTFLKGIVGGLLALLTPCVFPMIPLTVSYFLKGGKNKKKGFRDAIIYGLSIILLYVGLGVIVTTVFGAGALNSLASDPWFNLALAVLLIVFAFSFFGYFEIQLPSKWADKTDRVADKGGFIGIIAMAATLALVSFSCTGPLIGVLLVDAVSANTGGGIPIEPIVGMLGFSLSLALPFALFAAFPSWLSSLPKSGGWMDDVKTSVGFIELALSLKFLAVFSLIMEKQLGFKVLPYEAFVALWVIIAILWALYFLGLFRFKKDPYASKEKKKIPVKKLVFGVLLLAVAAWNATGFKTAHGSFQPTALMSGLAPHAGHSYIHPSECPHGINCYHDYFVAKKIAKEQNKPLFIDFTGHACENCRKNEANIWPEEGVIEKLRNDYVVVSLYVDDKTKLAEAYKSQIAGNEGRKRREGQKWADFQVAHFGSNAQPLYVLTKVNEDNTVTVLNKPVGGLVRSVDDYKAFLQCGLDIYKDLDKK